MTKHVVTRIANGMVAIREPSPDSSLPLGGKLVGLTRKVGFEWHVIWRDHNDLRHSTTKDNSIDAEATLYEVLGIAPQAGDR